MPIIMSVPLGSPYRLMLTEPVILNIECLYDVMHFRLMREIWIAKRSKRIIHISLLALLLPSLETSPSLLCVTSMEKLQTCSCRTLQKKAAVMLTALK